MHEQHVNGLSSESVGVQLMLAVPFLLVACFYMMAVLVSARHMRGWPIRRTLLFMVGIGLALLTVAGPLAVRAHDDFVAHMGGHLLLGMLAPLLIALGRPMTLMVRVLPVWLSRVIVSWLKRWPIKLWLNPVFTGLLNVGGLWLLYTTRLFELMHVHVWLYLLVHVHLFLAGYLFTVSISQLEPFGERVRLWVRAAVLLFAMALHGVLAKLLYVEPPSGVSLSEAEMGAMMMYYGGDIVDALLIVVLCLEWYRAERSSLRASKIVKGGHI